MKQIALFTLILLAISLPAYAEDMIIFTGTPDLKISEGGLSRVPEKLDKEKANKVKCTITKRDDKYYWTSRENIELMPISGGAFITYLAVNGSGYVRIVKPVMRAEIRQMGSIAGDPEGQYDYVEHLLLGLKSITYYGTSK